VASFLICTELATDRYRERRADSKVSMNVSECSLVLDFEHGSTFIKSQSGSVERFLVTLPDPKRQAMIG
jgi:hypothetical protein